MEFKRLQTLKIDREFKNLIRPLRKREYLQLEQNLIAYGCIDPIITWNGYIIDGHNRYDICHRHNIPFTTLAMEFSCREEAIAWICANQLGRRNITEETRRFLIGMQYESEKIVNSKKNAQGVNQYSEEGSEIGSPEGDVTHPSEEWSDAPSGHKTAQRIAEENHISWNTVQKYAIYTRALEAIGQKVPDLVPKILSGRYKISHKNIVELSMLTPAQIQKVVARIESDEQPFVRYKDVRINDFDAEYEHPTKYSSGRGSYVERNQAMIDDSDICVFYYDENYLPLRRKNSPRDISDYQPKSGTRIAYEYAIKKEKRVINTSSHLREW